MRLLLPTMVGIQRRIIDFKRQIVGHLFKLINPKICFSCWPIIVGHWPRIRNAGTLKIGISIMFMSYRSPSRLAVEKGGFLEIGDHGFINEGVDIRSAISIKIGDRVKIGPMVLIFDTDFHQVSPGSKIKKRPVYIGNNVWLGARCVILPGANIGDHAVIGAGAVVTGIIPPGSVAVGNPARIVKKFSFSNEWVRE